MKNITIGAVLLLLFNLATAGIRLVFDLTFMPGAFEIGWPYVFYQRFRFRIDAEYNHGWRHPRYFFVDQLIGIAFIVLIFFVVKKWKGSRAKS